MKTKRIQLGLKDLGHLNWTEGLRSFHGIGMECQHFKDVTCNEINDDALMTMIYF